MSYSRGRDILYMYDEEEEDDIGWNAADVDWNMGIILRPRRL